MIERYTYNTRGRDYAVGDIHGCFTELRKALAAIKFDPARDRLFSVGDLVDRGPESDKVLEWLEYPWFHAVRGNHDDYCCRYETVDACNWMAKGGSWFYALSTNEQQSIATLLRWLPLAIEVETAAGLIGIVHAGIPGNRWDTLRGRLESRAGRDYCMWTRTRFEHEDDSIVAGVRALVVGHQPVRRPVVLGNVYHIDTRGWLPEDGGYFTLLDLATLEAVPALPQALVWED